MKKLIVLLVLAAMVALLLYPSPKGKNYDGEWLVTKIKVDGKDITIQLNDLPLKSMFYNYDKLEISHGHFLITLFGDINRKISGDLTFEDEHTVYLKCKSQHFLNGKYNITTDSKLITEGYRVTEDSWLKLVSDNGNIIMARRHNEVDTRFTNSTSIPRGRP